MSAGATWWDVLRFLANLAWCLATDHVRFDLGEYGGSAVCLRCGLPLGEGVRPWGR